ncbi:conserved uncharacterized protein [Desulfobacula toluolica Tol2]|uniref:Conserved uncharacterized protein n=2 Tax=Desulfobacula toluolica TaxID=28223 RepID=K0NDG7_DESTT|nr:conserved uncharacterized protein [Desulfobacula toluolica Tol2]
MSILLRVTLLSFLVSLFFATSSFADGRILIKPHIETGWQRDTNFHKSDTNTKTVDTYNVKPGIELGYTTGKSLVSLDYWFNVLEYDDQDNVSADPFKAGDFDYIEHMADFTAQTQFTDHLLIGLDNFFQKTSDPANAQANSNATDRFKYIMNRFTPRLLYNFGNKFGLGLKYTNLITDYSDDDVNEGEDSVENRGTFTFYYYLNQKTSFDLDYQYWNRDYDNNASFRTSDYDSNQVMLNLTHQFNYLSFTAGAGYHAREFDTPPLKSGDIEQFVWKLSVSGQNPPDAEGIPKSSIYLSLGSNLNDSGSGETYYNSTRFDAQVTHLFMEKINCTLAGWFQNSDYETEDREDDRWFMSAAADYLINDFFSLGLEGGFEERDSNKPGKDFDNKYIQFNVKFNYNMGDK